LPNRLSPLKQVYASLLVAIEAFSKDSENDLLRDGLIQRFEFTYELAWKTVKRYLESEHQEVAADQWSRRDLYRKAAEVGLIDDPNAWFEFMALRNLSSHTYNRETAEKVANAIPDFASSCAQLLSELSRRLDQDAPNPD
jgi:nucleotidyltransferase substrate binding protein (TIGR01987 family)